MLKNNHSTNRTYFSNATRN